MIQYLTNPMIIGLLIYMAIQIIIAIISTKYIKTAEDFFVAGRNLSLFSVSISVFATWFGAETCISAAGQIYANGIGFETIEPFAYSLCLILSGIFFIRKFWDLNIITLSDFFCQRFSHHSERLSAIILIPPSLFWASAQVRAFGHILSSIISIDIEIAIFIAVIIVIAYTVIGGLLADVYTDIFQAFILITGLIVIVVLFLVDLKNHHVNQNSIIEKVHFFSSNLGFWEIIEMWAIPLCGSITAQEVIQRTVAAKSNTIARNSTIIGGLFYLTVGLIPVFLGLYGHYLLPSVSQPEQFLPLLAQKTLSPMLSIIFIGALISAILSTVDSSLLAASSLFMRNIMSEKSINSEKKKLIFARSLVIVFGILSWWLAVSAESVFSLVEDASSFGSSGIFVAVIFGLFTPKGKGLSATFCLLFGVIFWIIGDYFLQFSYPYLISLIAALLGFLIGIIIEKYFYLK